jgi:hypothetical protein
MTVAELIAELTKHPLDTEICIESQNGECTTCRALKNQWRGSRGECSLAGTFVHPRIFVKKSYSVKGQVLLSGY